MKEKFGLCIDWETSGSAWGQDSTIDFQGVSFGAAVFNLQTFEVVDTIYREVQFDESKYKWSEQAERIHGLSRDHLAKNGVTREQAAIDLMSWFIKYFAPDEYVYIMGHHVDFDIKFTKQLLEEFGIMFKIGATQIDTSGAGLIMFGVHKSEDLFTMLGLPPRTQHNALEDVILTIEAARVMKEITKIAIQ